MTFASSKIESSRPDTAVHPTESTVKEMAKNRDRNRGIAIIVALTSVGVVPIVSYLDILGVSNSGLTFGASQLLLLVSMLVLPTCFLVISLRKGPQTIVGKFAARGDSEHEQIVLRLVLMAIIIGTLTLTGRLIGAEPSAAAAVTVGSVGMAVSWLFLFHLWWKPARSVPRRILAMLTDLIVLSWVLHLGAEIATPWFIIYLWVTFGNGFRYGNRYLLLSATFSVVSFIAVIATTPLWQQHMLLTVGLIGALILLPGYVSTLIAKLTEAVALAEDANQAKSQFLARMSHELRTPLNAIIGMGDLLHVTSLDSDQKDMTGTISTAAHSLLAQVNDILDFSKIEIGGPALTHAPFDLHQRLSAVRLLTHQLAEVKGLQLIVSVDPKIPYRLSGDAERLQGILVNLVANAIKFTHEGYVAIRVTAGELTDDRAALRFCVEDSGIGIPEENIDTIFDSFARVESNETDRIEGTGLGLAISRQLVELLGGQMTVESTVGEGSRFAFEINFAPNEKSEDELSFEAGQVTYLTDVRDEDTPDLAATALAEFGIDAFITDNIGEAASHCLEDREGSAHRILIIGDRGHDPVIADILTPLSQARGDGVLHFVLISDKGSDGFGQMTASIDKAHPPYLTVLGTPLDRDQFFNALHLGEQMIRPVGVEADENTQEGRGTTNEPLTVLVADDNAVNRKVVGKILTRAGHHVEIVTNGDDALDALEENSFDLALLDVNMPGLNGPETTKHYRMAHMDEPPLPIIALTADATVSTRDWCLSAGMDAVITKPVEPAKLIAEIEDIAAAHRERHGLERVSGTAPMLADDTEPAPIQSTPHLRLISSSILDPKALEDLWQLDTEKEFFAEVVDEFFADGRELMGDIERAVTSDSLSSIRRAVHSLRSSAAHVGAHRVRARCKELHELENTDIATKGQALLSELQIEFDAASVELTHEVKRRTGLQLSASL